MSGARAALSPTQSWLAGLLGTNKADAGMIVNADTALTYSSVFAAVSMISSDIAGLPLQVYNVEEDGDQVPEPKHSTTWVLDQQPNDMQTSVEFRELLQSWALLYGNGYAFIDRDGAGRVQRLIPVDPTIVSRDIVDHKLYYDVQFADGETRRYSSDRMFHLRGLGGDATGGYSVLKLARNSWGLGLAEEQHGSGHFANRARPDIVLESDHNIDPKTAERFITEWEERHKGAANSGRPALLSNGITVKPLLVSNEDSQWLESRKFQRVEVASWFQLPPHKLGDDSKIAYNSIEAENRAYLTMTLRRWLVKWEQEATRKLINERDRRAGTKKVKHDQRPLIGSDMSSTATIMSQLVSAEIVTRNEGRQALGYNRMDDPEADELRNPNTGSYKEDSEPEPEEKDDEKDGEGLDAIKDLLTDRLERFNKIEASGIAKVLKGKKRPYMEAVQDFYSAHSKKMVDAILPILRVADANGFDVIVNAHDVADNLASVGVMDVSVHIKNCLGDDQVSDRADTVAAYIMARDTDVDNILGE